jgi:hypothetical protein
MEVEEPKSVPFAPVSNPFVERLIETIRREYLDRVFFWNAVDLARKLNEYKEPSRPGELHPEPLTEPDVSLSTYPARATG